MGSKHRRRLACSAAVAVWCVFGSDIALAEPSAAQKETARSLMAEGRDLRDEKDFAAALDRFRAADAIMGVPTTGYELAKAQSDVFQLVEARATLRRILGAPEAASDPEPFKVARHHALELDAELDARIGALRFVVSGASAGEPVSISVDGEPVPTATVSLPFRLNPGHHRVVARAHQAEVVRDVEAVERDTLAVALDLPASVAPAPPPVALPPTPAEHRVPRLAYVTGSIGAAGLVVGTVTGIFALSKKHSAEQGCVANKCPPSTWSDVDSAHSLATVSTIAFVVGGAGVGVALASLLLAKPTTDTSIRTGLVVSRQFSSLSVSGRF